MMRGSLQHQELNETCVGVDYVVLWSRVLTVVNRSAMVVMSLDEGGEVSEEARWY